MKLFICILLTIAISNAITAKDYSDCAVDCLGDMMSLTSAQCDADCSKQFDKDMDAAEKHKSDACTKSDGSGSLSSGDAIP